MSNLIDIDGRLIDADHARIALQIMEGGASNAIALAGEVVRMLVALPDNAYGELRATKELFAAVREARIAADNETAARLVGILVESANSEHVLIGLDYAPVYIVLDQVRNILGLTCHQAEYYARWGRMWGAVREAAGQ